MSSFSNSCSSGYPTTEICLARRWPDSRTRISLINLTNSYSQTESNSVCFENKSNPVTDSKPKTNKQTNKQTTVVHYKELNDWRQVTVGPSVSLYLPVQNCTCAVMARKNDMHLTRLDKNLPRFQGARPGHV